MYNFRTVSLHYSEAVSLVRSLDHDKVTALDQTFIETALFSLFRVDILNLIKIKASLAKEFHIQPSEIDNMTAWEYELFMKELNNIVKEENKRNEQEMDKSGYNDIKKYSDPGYMNKMQRSYTNNMKMPKMPSVPKM